MRLGEPQGLSVLRLFDSALWQTSPHLQRQELLPWLRLNLTLKGAEEQQWGWHSGGDGCCQGAELQGGGDRGKKGQEGDGGCKTQRAGAKGGSEGCQSLAE